MARKKRLKVTTEEEIQAEKALTELNISARNQKFFATISEDKIRQFAALIYQMEEQGKKEHEMAQRLGLTVGQVQYIMQHPAFEESYHMLIEDDAEAIRSVLRPGLEQVANTLKERAKAGDMKAVALYMKIMGADKPPEDTIGNQLEWFMKRIMKAGFKNKSQIASERIAAQIAEDDVVDSTAEVIEEEHSEDEMYRRVRQDPDSDPDTDSEDDE